MNNEVSLKNYFIDWKSYLLRSKKINLYYTKLQDGYFTVTVFLFICRVLRMITLSAPASRQL